MAHFSISAQAASSLGRCAALASTLHDVPVHVHDVMFAFARSPDRGQVWIVRVMAPTLYQGEGKSAATALFALEKALRDGIRERAD